MGNLNSTAEHAAAGMAFEKCWAHFDAINNIDFYGERHKIWVSRTFCQALMQGYILPKTQPTTTLRCAALRCAALRCAALRCAALHYTMQNTVKEWSEYEKAIFELSTIENPVVDSLFGVIYEFSQRWWYKPMQCWIFLQYKLSLSQVSTIYAGMSVGYIIFNPLAAWMANKVWEQIQSLQIHVGTEFLWMYVLLVSRTNLRRYDLKSTFYHPTHHSFSSHFHFKFSSLIITIFFSLIYAAIYTEIKINSVNWNVLTKWVILFL